MNRWKISFFVLAGLVLAAIIYIVTLVSLPGISDPRPIAIKGIQTGQNLTVQASKEDVEGLANKYIKMAMKDDAIPLALQIDKDIVITSEIPVFSIRIPVRMHFNPIIEEEGNLILEQTAVEIGMLNLPPSTVLKLLRDSVDLPDWMLVRPKEEEVFISLNELPIPGNIGVKAKEFDLTSNQILLEINVPE